MFWLLSLLLLRLVLLIYVAQSGVIGLAPDEAQYWTWSQCLDWGYYSKPPGIAWQIAATTSLFGDTAFGVRAGPLLIGCAWVWLLVRLARAAGVQEKTAIWCGILAICTPLGVYLSFAATTDGGAIFCVTGALLLYIQGLRSEKGPNYYGIGSLLCLGALFKWTVYIFWPFALLSLSICKQRRKGSFWIGLFISLLALLPTLYWNAQHEWATFKHVGKTVAGVSGGNFFSFFGSQIGLLSPICFLLLCISYGRVKQSENQALVALALYPSFAAIYLILSIWKKIQPNWALYLYPPALVLVAWVACEYLRRGRIWLYTGVGLSIVTLLFLFSIPWIQHTLPLSYRYNPFRQMMGWKEIAPLLTQAGYSPKTDFLCADKYQTVSLLSFYAPKQRAYLFDVCGHRKNQFSYWPSMAEKEKGKSGYFAVFENTTAEHLSYYVTDYLHKLEDYFQECHCVGSYPLFCVAGKPVKYALLFRCSGYNGSMPLIQEQY